jgi:CRP/FNR family transcriptional regulator
MPDPAAIEALRGFQPYGNLPDEAIGALAERACLRTFAENEVIAKRGERGDKVLLVLAGSILAVRESPDSRERAAIHFHTGDSVGETLVLRHIHYPYDMYAVKNGTRVLEVVGEDFERLFREHPELQRSVVDALTNKLIALAKRIVSLSLASANTRLARYVLALPRKDLGGAPEVELPLAKKDLATLMAITPEHLSRILRRWNDARLVRMADRGLLLLNMPILEAMADIHDTVELSGWDPLGTP